MVVLVFVKGMVMMALGDGGCGGSGGVGRWQSLLLVGAERRSICHKWIQHAPSADAPWGRWLQLLRSVLDSPLPL